MKTINEVKKKLKKTHPEVTIDPDTYRGTSYKATFTDKEFGKWTARVYDVLNGTRHPKRWAISIGNINRTSVEKVVIKLKKMYGDLIILEESTYVGIGNKATFIHKIRGKWITQPRYVLSGMVHPKDISEKSQKTCLRKYGVPFTHQNKEIALKAARSSNIANIKFHWKTNEELICQGGYEYKAVDYLNKNNIDFKWQPKVFKMPNGKTYRPDLYLINENKWIEIKGYFRKDSKEKWDWFQSIMLNSELWDKSKLKKMGIL